MAYFEEKTIRKKKAAALLLYMQLEHDKKLLQEQHHFLQVFSLFIPLSLKQRPFSFSNRLTHCRVRQTSVLTRIVLCQFHAKDGFKVLGNCHHEA